MSSFLIEVWNGNGTRTVCDVFSFTTNTSHIEHLVLDVWILWFKAQSFHETHLRTQQQLMLRFLSSFFQYDVAEVRRHLCCFALIPAVLLHPSSSQLYVGSSVWSSFICESVTAADWPLSTATCRTVKLHCSRFKSLHLSSEIREKLLLFGLQTSARQVCTEVKH